MILHNGKTHPVAEMFPLLPPDELNAMVESIRQIGQRTPITLGPDGTLWDGRNRLIACQTAGVTPVFEMVGDDVDPVAVILAANVHRRHMDKDTRRALVARLREEGRSTRAIADT